MITICIAYYIGNILISMDIILFNHVSEQIDFHAKGYGDTMIKVSVFYPNAEGKNFNTEYFLNKHLPLVQETLGSLLKRTSADVGLAGGEPGAPAPFKVIGHLFFDSVEAFQTAFGPHAQALMGDIPNFTDIQPVIQISDVKR
jgi:uncharacterized protein (TIGR02118 family)